MNLRGRKKGLMISLSIGLIISVVLVFSEYVDILQFLELKTLDWKFRLRGVEKPSGKVVILAVDQKSITRLGRWPWDRSVFASLLDRLQVGGAKVVGFDIIFSEPQLSDTLQKIGYLKERFKRLNNLSNLPDGKQFLEDLARFYTREDHDYHFGSAIQKAGNVVLATVFTRGHSSPDPPDFALKSTYSLLENTENINIFLPITYPVLSLPIPELGEAAAGVGFVNFFPDVDGALRWEMMVIAHKGEFYPSLTIQMLRHALDLPDQQFGVRFGEGIILGDTVFPTDERGRYLISYYGPNYTFPHYSIIDVIDGKVPPEAFRNKLVLVGAAAPGLGDMWSTPFSGNLLGVEKHATVLENLLHQRFVTRSYALTFVDVALLLLLAIILGIFLMRLPPLYGSLFSLGMLGAFIAFHQWVFQSLQVWLYESYGILQIGVTFGVVMAYNYMTEEKEKKWLKGAFQQYMNPSVVKRIMETPDLLKLGGEKKELTVLFTDIRGFTTMSEKMSPEELVQFMNEYLSAMTNIILENDGTLDKYMGDAVMAIYGAPVHQDDHALRACHAAIKMFETLYDLRENWGRRGLPMVKMGVGINTGDMVVGNMGSDKRFDYTVMGDHVNLGSRLEGLTKTYGAKIILSEYTYDKVKTNLVCRELDFVRVKGKREPARIYELLGTDYFTHGRYEFLSPFEKGLEAHRRKEWDEAIDFFGKVLAIKPGDNPAQYFIERSRELRISPPPPDWDGISTKTEK